MTSDDSIWVKPVTDIYFKRCCCSIWKKYGQNDAKLTQDKSIFEKKNAFLYWPYAILWWIVKFEINSQLSVLPILTTNFSLVACDELFRRCGRWPLLLGHPVQTISIKISLHKMTKQVSTARDISKWQGKSNTFGINFFFNRCLFNSMYKKISTYQI